ncbi:MAG: hypothetical protein ACJ74Q_15250 [Pyrinomonadaceae bacterium]
MNDNIFIGIHAAGVVYADRQQEVAGDYKRLAFLCYETLELKVEDDCPEHLARDIVESAAGFQMRRGLPFEISGCGASVILGGKSSKPWGVEEARMLLRASVCAGDPLIEANYPYANPLNDRSRLLIQSYINEHGAAWLGRVNIYREVEGRPVIWQCADATSVQVYGAAFVLPAFDDELRHMIVTRHITPYTGTAQDSQLVEAIFDRIEGLGGSGLFWN